MISRLQKILTANSFIRDIFYGAKYFLDGMAAFNNFVLLSFVYFFGFGISFIINRLLGVDKKEKEKLTTQENPSTHWIPLTLGNENADTYYQPY